MKSRHLALLTPLVLLSVLFSVLSDASNLSGTGGGSGGGSGSISMGALDGTTAAATGAVISGSSLYMQSATASVPGLVNTTSQVFAGIKRAQDGLYVGTAPSEAIPFNVDATMTTSSGSYFVGNVIGRRTVSTTDSTTTYGHLGQTILTVSSGQSAHGITTGLLGEVKPAGAGTTDFAGGVRGVVTNTGTGGVTNAASFIGGTIANSGGGSITNTYGLYLNNNTVGTTNYPIYSLGTSESYLTGGSSISAGKFFVSNEGNLSKVNNVYYNWPASQGSATTYLKNDGSGNLTWASVASGSGDVVGPASSVDGNIATMNGTTGKLIRSESKFTVNPTTGAIAKTFASTPTTLDSTDLSTATTWSTARLLTGTTATTAATTYIDRSNYTFDIGSTNRTLYISNVSPTISGSTSASVFRDYSAIIAASSGTSVGGQFASFSGVFGNFTAMYNTNSTGVGVAHYGWMNANKAVGARGLAYAGQGSSGKAIGVNGSASTENSPSIAAAGYFSMNTSTTTLEGDTFPAISGALIADTGNVATTIPAFVALNNGSSVFQVRGTGETVIGANGGTARHIVNGTIKIGRQTPLSVVSLTDGASVALDASLGNTFRLVAGGDRTLQAPSNPIDGQKIIIQHFASGGARTLTLTTGAGGFRFGTDITTIAATSSGKTDYIGAIYNLADNRWDVIAVVTGY